MKSIYLLQWQRFRRAPFLVLAMLGLTFIFVFFIAVGIGSENELTVYTYADASLEVEEKNAWLEKLNEADGFEFVWMEESEARQAVAVGDVSLAVQLLENDYRILVAADEQNRYIVEEHVHQVYSEELRVREIEERGAGSEFRDEVKRLLADPPLTVVTSSLEGEDESVAGDGRLQHLFGMTLFFSIFTIMFNLSTVAVEKRTGTWDRLILSPLRKWQMYIGHLLYCFTVGYVQIVLVFLFFQYVFGFDLGDRLETLMFIIGCYTFAIVALGMLLMGLFRTPQQLQTVIPIVANAIAMLGGAFWPLEGVTNEIMLALSKGMPITYALDALKEAAIYGRGLLDLAEPLSFMLLFGVICMGVGINLMERRM